MTVGHGLVIGKFYPPHAGHRLLIETAARACDRVSVIVMASNQESIDLAQRVDWMQEIHRVTRNVHVTGIQDDIPVDYDDPLIWDQHVALMRCALEALAAGNVDAVFTSEPYGTELARRLGARPVTLDLSRTLVPISATQVREDVPGAWEFLAPAVRAALALRVVVLGAESTGTTTLSQDIVTELRRRGGADGLTRWVPEYGRHHSVRKCADAVAAAQLKGQDAPDFASLYWSPTEFMTIARTQRRLEDAEARLGGPVLVCDTDVFATAVWHERYLARRSRAVETLADRRAGDLYLLTHHESVQFVQDGIRDGEAIREWMTTRFIDRLQASGRPFVIMKGTREARLATAIRAIDELRQRSWSYAPPQG